MQSLSEAEVIGSLVHLNSYGPGVDVYSPSHEKDVLWQIIRAQMYLTLHMRKCLLIGKACRKQPVDVNLSHWTQAKGSNTLKVGTSHKFLFPQKSRLCRAGPLWGPFWAFCFEGDYFAFLLHKTFYAIKFIIHSFFSFGCWTGTALFLIEGEQKKKTSICEPMGCNGNTDCGVLEWKADFLKGWMPLDL